MTTTERVLYKRRLEKIFYMLLLGLTNEEIANHFQITTRSVQKYKRKLEERYMKYQEQKNIGKIAFYDLIITVCKNNKQVATWLGYEEGKSLRIDNNHKTREVRDMLLDHSNIKKVQDNPLVLQWQPDTSDTSDINHEHNSKKNDNQNTEKNNETTSETMSDMSGMSDRTTSGKVVDLGKANLTIMNTIRMVTKVTKVTRKKDQTKTQVIGKE